MTEKMAGKTKKKKITGANKEKIAGKRNDREKDQQGKEIAEKRINREMNTNEQKKQWWLVTLESMFLAFGVYFSGRIIRNNLYYALLEPLSERHPVAQQILQYCGHLIFILMILLYCRFSEKDRELLSIFSISDRRRSLVLILGGLVCGFLTNSASVAAAILHGDIDMVHVGADPLPLLLSFAAVALQSSAEELQYRVMGTERILRSAPPVYAVIGSAVVFSLSHCLNPGISVTALLNIFLCGVIWALSVLRFRNVLFACAYHTMWNFTQNFIYGLPNSGSPAVLTEMAPTFTKKSLFYDPEFGVEGTLFVTVMQTLIIAVMLAAPKAPNKKHSVK